MRNLALVLISAFFFSCETDTDIGLDLIDSKTGVFFTDTLSLSYGTYQMDSVITSGQNFALIGVANDPLFGKVKATSYLQPTLEFSTQNQQGYFNFEYQEEIIPDSVVIRLWNRNLTYFGDSLGNATFRVHRLRGSIPDRNYNNDDALPYDPEVLGSSTFSLQTMKGDSASILPVRIKLSNTILEELNAIRGTDNARTLEAFENAFKGFVIVPDDNSKAAFGFNIGPGTGVPGGAPVSSLDYYFHLTGDSVAAVYNFEFRSNRFHQVLVDRAGTAIAGLTSKRQVLPSSQSNNEVFVQAGTGSAAFVQFPGVKGITRGSTISKAELVFEVNKDAFNTNFAVAPIVVPVELRNDGSVRRDQAFGYSYISNALNTSTANLGFLNDSLGTIRVDITPYVRDLVLKNRQDSGIIIASGSTVSATAAAGSGVVFNAGLNRIILRKPKLELLYSN